MSLTRGLPLLASVVGAFVGGLSMLPWIFPNHLDWPAYLSYPVNAVGLLSIPGMFLSLVATSLLQRGVAHDPSLLLGGVINVTLYAALGWWVMRRRVDFPKKRFES